MAVDDIECAVPYWSAIAKTLGCHEVTAIRMKSELKDAGIIFYRRQRGGKRIVYHFPSRLRVWASHKGRAGEIV
jgi:hypothetical protein